MHIVIEGGAAKPPFRASDHHLERKIPKCPNAPMIAAPAAKTALLVKQIRLILLKNQIHSVK